MAEIVLDGISKKFADGFEAVKDLNLEIADGEFMILVGPSGCGKSTALRMIAGLEDITDGELTIGGNVVNERAPKDRDIAMVFQNYALYPHMSVRENMAFPLRLAKVDDAEVTKKVEEAAEVLDLDAPSRPQAREPLGRPAPARGDGPRDRARPLRLPDGRAALEPRRQAARADAHRGGATSERPGNDHRLRHPRSDRGDDARGSRCGDARGRPPAGGLAGRPLQRAEKPLRRGLHRLARDELHGGDDRGRTGQAALRRGGAALGASREARLALGQGHRGRSARELRGRRPGRRREGPRHHVHRRRSTWSSRWAPRSTRTSRSRASRSSPKSSRSWPRTRAPQRCRARARAWWSRGSTQRQTRSAARATELWVDSTKLHFFDPDSGANLGH